MPCPRNQLCPPARAPSARRKDGRGQQKPGTRGFESRPRARQQPPAARRAQLGTEPGRAGHLASPPRTCLGQDLSATLFPSSRTHTQDSVRGSHAGSFSARVRRPQPTAPAQNQLPGHVLQTIAPIGSGLRFTADQSEGKINLQGREERGGQLETRGGAMWRLPETLGLAVGCHGVAKSICG